MARSEHASQRFRRTSIEIALEGETQPTRVARRIDFMGDPVIHQHFVTTAFELPGQRIVKNIGLV